MSNSEEIVKLLQNVQMECKDYLTLNLNSVKNMSKGCDQLVFMMESVEHGRVVVKIPKEEKDKVEKQVIMSQKALSGGLNVTNTLYHNENFLIESFVPGCSPGMEILESENREFWINLGHQMKLLHSIPGAVGYSNRVVGETCTKFPIYDSYQAKHADGIIWNDSSVEIEGINEYFAHMLSQIRTVPPVFLHYDIAFDNIINSNQCDDRIQTSGNEIGNTAEVKRVFSQVSSVISDNVFKVTLIDFADAGMGDPMEDFALLYCYLRDTPQFKFLLEGYGGVSAEDTKWMEFFSMVWLTWALCGGEEEEKRALREQQLKFAREVVSRWRTSRS